MEGICTFQRHSRDTIADGYGRYFFCDLVLPTRHVPQCAGHGPAARKRGPYFSSDLVLHVVLLELFADGCNSDARRCYRSQYCLSLLLDFPYFLRVSLILSELVSVLKHVDLLPVY